MNRDNYEMYFLLYLDNELGPEERLEVEYFIQQHPDLAGELEQLRGLTALPESAFSFPDKQSLYRQEPSAEDLLCYLDNELDVTARGAIEAEISYSPQLQQQLEALRQVVLEPETIVFEQKELLYRREKRRVIPIAWSRIAVAAAVAVLSATGVWMLTEQPASKPPQAAAVVPSAGQQQDAGDVVPVAKTPESLPVVADAAPVVKASQKLPQQHNTVAANNTAPITGKDITTLARIEDNIVSLSNNTLLRTAETPDFPPAAKMVVAEARPAVVPEKQVIASSDIVYKELDTSDEAQSLYVGSLELNKNKLTGLLKKAGRLIGGKAKNSEQF